MNHPRHPSGPSSIRHRSGAFSQGSVSGLSLSSQSNDSQAHRAGVDHAKPTVALVQKKRPRSRIPSLPVLPPAPGYPDTAANALLLHIPYDASRHPAPIPKSTSHVYAPVDIPAEACPPTSRSLGSLHASTSDIPLLAQEERSEYEDQYHSLPRLSRYPAHVPGRLVRPPSAASAATFPMRPKPAPPEAPKHSSAFSSLSTADRLTRKFPLSRTVRGLALDSAARRRSVLASPASIGSSLEESRGLGMDRPARWTPHKWWLFLSIWTVFAYGVGGLVCALLTWGRAWEHADVMLVADYDILVLVTLAASLLLFTFSVGMTGTLLNSRPILAVYALLLWPAFVALLAVGYTAYKRSAFALDRKLNHAWSEYYSTGGRRALQDALWCCGYNSPLHEAAPSGRCYARAALPGCKGRLLRVERALLRTVWAAAFALVPLHVANIAVALLCANHVTRTFGKGVMPRQYRLCGADVQADAERILGTIQPVGLPAMSRTVSSASCREDKVEAYAPSLTGIPAALRPANGLARRYKPS